MSWVEVENISSENGSFEAPALLGEDAILFPEMEVTITARDSQNVAATTQAFREHNLVVVVPARNPDTVVGSIGTLVLLQKTLPAGGEGTQTLSKGLWRVRIESLLEVSPYVRVKFTRAGEIETPPGNNKSTAMMVTVFGQIDEFVRMMPGIPPEIIAFLKGTDAPGKLADLCAYSPFFTLEEKLELLRTLDPEERLAKVNRFFERQLSDLKRLAKAKTIPECTTCIELADKAFELGPNRSMEVAREFLNHVNAEHVDELLVLLAEKYGPIFLRRRQLK